MDIIIVPLLQVIRVLLNLYLYGLFIFGILLMLESFNVIDSYNKIVYKVHNTLFSIYNPALEKIRSIFNFGGAMDFSIIILYLLIYFIKHVLIRIIDLF